MCILAFYIENRNQTAEPFHSIPLYFHAIYLASSHNPRAALANLVNLKDYNVVTILLHCNTMIGSSKGNVHVQLEAIYDVFF